MLQIAICDDNIDELAKMTQLIDQYRVAKHLNCEFAAFANGFDLLYALEKGKHFDIYCLDILMPAFSGIDVAKEIRRQDKSSPILFFTTSSEFALESYGVKALNYVLKPISKEKLFLTLDEVLEQITLDKDDTIIVKSTEGLQKIHLFNLVYAEVMGRNVLYHLLSGKVVECKDSFASVCDTLEKFGSFLRIHRSYIVNMQYIDTIENHQVTLNIHTTLPIAQGRGREIKEKYLAFQMEEE